MKVMIPLQGPSLDAPVDPRFGRALYYAVVEPGEEEKAEVFPNPFAFYPSAAGIAAAQLAIQKGVKVVVAPHLGPNAFMVLSSAGIQAIPFAGLNGREVLKNLSRGNLPSAPFPSRADFLRTQISALESQLNALKTELKNLEKQKEEK